MSTGGTWSPTPARTPAAPDSGPVPGVCHRVGLGSEVLARYPVAGADRRVAAGLPDWRAAEFVAARTLLRVLLRELTPDADRLPIQAQPSGRPWLPELPEVGISLSHSGPWVAAAIGCGRQVGIDIELPVAVSAGLARRCCQPADVETLAGLPPTERSERFSWLWTAQEACVKASGHGLAGQPWRVPVRLGQTTGSWGAVRWAALAGSPVPAACAWTVTTQAGGPDSSQPPHRVGAPAPRREEIDR